ncbi:MAG: penicillin-insensitive murein endopeptidase [Pseudomonadota bacterium]
MHWIAITVAALLATSAQAEPAHALFGSHKAPSAAAPAAFGSYARGCLSGGMKLRETTSGWQAMRLSRNRNWGHPEMISFIERLSRNAQQIGWPRIYVGDIGQPRGGPMRSGHRSHQIGLDADIWLRMPSTKKLSRKDRERIGSHVVVAKDGITMNQFWTLSHHEVIRTAAEDPAVARIFVNAAIKRAMCQEERAGNGLSDAPWLRKVRPWHGHNAHFHVRLACPRGSPGCRDQAPPPSGTGCGAELSKWFPRGQKSRSIGLSRRWEEAQQPTGNERTRSAKRVLTMDDLPRVCNAVLAEDGAEVFDMAAIEPEAPELNLPVFPGGTQRAHDGFVGTSYFWRPKVDLNAARQQAISLKIAGRLPDGLRFVDRGNGNGLLSGTPMEQGDFEFEIIAERRGSEHGRQQIFLPVVALNSQAAGQSSLSAERSLDHQVRDFLTDFVGDECFLAQPSLVSEQRIDIEAFSDDTAPFYDFDGAFKSSVGIEANVGGRMITSPQCRALSFARLYPGRGATEVAIDDPDRTMSPGETTRIRLSDRPDRATALMVIDPNGYVIDLTKTLVRQGGQIRTALRASVPGPHILLALDSASPLGNLSLDGTAEVVFAGLSREKAVHGADLKSSLGYFILQ